MIETKDNRIGVGLHRCIPRTLRIDLDSILVGQGQASQASSDIDLVLRVNVFSLSDIDDDRLARVWQAIEGHRLGLS